MDSNVSDSVAPSRLLMQKYARLTGSRRLQREIKKGSWDVCRLLKFTKCFQGKKPVNFYDLPGTIWVYLCDFL